MKKIVTGILILNTLIACTKEDVSELNHISTSKLEKQSNHLQIKKLPQLINIKSSKGNNYQMLEFDSYEHYEEVIEELELALEKRVSTVDETFFWEGITEEEENEIIDKSDFKFDEFKHFDEFNSYYDGFVSLGSIEKENYLNLLDQYPNDYENMDEYNRIDKLSFEEMFLLNKNGLFAVKSYGADNDMIFHVNSKLVIDGVYTIPFHNSESKYKGAIDNFEGYNEILNQWNYTPQASTSLSQFIYNVNVGTTDSDSAEEPCDDSEFENLFTGVAKDVRRKVKHGKRYRFKGKIKYKTISDVNGHSKMKAKLKIKKKRWGAYLPKKKKSYVTLDMKLHRFDHVNCANIIINHLVGPQERNKSWNKLKDYSTTYSIYNNENIAYFSIPGKKDFSVTLDTDDWWELLFN